MAFCIEIGPGEISFGEDPNIRQVDGKRGHLSGTLVPMLVQHANLNI